MEIMVFKKKRMTKGLLEEYGMARGMLGRQGEAEGLKITPHSSQAQGGALGPSGLASRACIRQSPASLDQRLAAYIWPHQLISVRPSINQYKTSCPQIIQNQVYTSSHLTNRTERQKKNLNVLT